MVVDGEMLEDFVIKWILIFYLRCFDYYYSFFYCDLDQQIFVLKDDLCIFLFLIKVNIWVFVIGVELIIFLL